MTYFIKIQNYIKKYKCRHVNYEFEIEEIMKLWLLNRGIKIAKTAKASNELPTYSFGGQRNQNTHEIEIGMKKVRRGISLFCTKEWKKWRYFTRDA